MASKTNGSTSTSRYAPKLFLLFSFLNKLGTKKYQRIARMYDCTGLSRKCTLIKTGFKNLRTGTKANFRPFVDALGNIMAYLSGSGFI